MKSKPAPLPITMRSFTPFILLLWKVSGSAGDASRVLQKETVPQKACKDARQEIEKDSDGVSCLCEDLNVNTTLLSCMDECNYCNSDTSTCGNAGIVEGFGLLGTKESVADVFMYNKGKTEAVTISNIGCEINELDTLICSSCEVLVDGMACDACTLTVCESGENAGFQLPNFDCSSLEADSVIDLCDANLTVPKSSVFGHLSQEEGAFDVCYETTEMPSVHPSDAPSAYPSIFPSDVPSDVPSGVPTMNPTLDPTGFPSEDPSTFPSDAPSLVPSDMPSTSMPSDMPSTSMPTITAMPSALELETPAPTHVPTKSPTGAPTKETTDMPTNMPAPETVEPTDGAAESSSLSRSTFKVSAVLVALAPLVLSL